MVDGAHVRAPGAFEGFRAGQRATTLPVQFFTELLETIEDPDELRVTLYALYAIPRPGRSHALRVSALAAEAPLARHYGERAAEVVRRAVGLAAERGTLLTLGLDNAGEDDDALVLVNNESGRRLRDRIEHGLEAPPSGGRVVARSAAKPEGVAAVYEAEIGMLSPSVAAALGELSRHRWRKAGGAELAPVEGGGGCWPDGLDAGFRDISVAICRSRPEGDGEAAVREIEATSLALIARARRYIYAESQYFASRRIAEAIAHRLEEPDGPEFVLVNPFKSQGWLEPVAMDTARARLYGALHRLDRHRRLRIYHPFTAQGEPIYVHAKMTIVDDEVLHVGSSNMNNRSMRLDTECDVTIDAAHPGNEGAAGEIRSLRDSLLAEHLGVPADKIAAAIGTKGSLIEAVEALRGEGRSLRPYEIPDLQEVEKWLADNQVLDPEGAEDVFEAMSNGGLLRGLRGRLRHRALSLFTR